MLKRSSSSSPILLLPDGRHKHLILCHRTRIRVMPRMRELPAVIRHQQQRVQYQTNTVIHSLVFGERLMPTFVRDDPNPWRVSMALVSEGEGTRGMGSDHPRTSRHGALKKPVPRPHRSFHGPHRQHRESTCHRRREGVDPRAEHVQQGNQEQVHGEVCERTKQAWRASAERE